MSYVGGIPAHLVAADGLRFRPRLLLDTGEAAPDLPALTPRP